MDQLAKDKADPVLVTQTIKHFPGGDLKETPLLNLAAGFGSHQTPEMGPFGCPLGQTFEAMYLLELEYDLFWGLRVCSSTHFFGAFKVKYFKFTKVLTD